MKRGKKRDPGVAAVISKSSPRVEQQNRFVDRVESDSGSKVTAAVTHLLGPSRRRPADEAASYGSTGVWRAFSELATENHTQATSPSRPTVSPASRGATDDTMSSADTDQLPTVAPTVAETRLITRSKSSTLVGAVYSAPSARVRRSSPGKKKRRHRSSAKSNMGAEREPKETVKTEAALKSLRRSSVDGTPSDVFTPPETSVVGNFASVFHDLVAQAVSLYDGINVTTDVASIDTASTECHNRPSSKLAPAGSVEPTDNVSAHAPKNNEDPQPFTPSTSRNRGRANPYVQVGADAVLRKGKDNEVVPSDQKQARAVADVPATQKSPSSAGNDKALNVTFVTEMDSKRERLLYSAGICAVALIFAILMGAVIAVFYASWVPSPLTCITAECVAAREYLSALLNTSRDPCSDFYGYVCSSWIVEGQVGRSFRADSIAIALVKIDNNLLRREDADDDPTDLRLMRRIYQTCQRFTTDAHVRPFAAALESARKLLNWGTMRGVHTYHDLVVLLVRTSLLLGFHTVLAIQLLSDDRRIFLRLSCGRSLLQKLTTSEDRSDLEATLRIVNDNADEITRILEMDDGVNGHLEGCANSDERKDGTFRLDEILDDLVPTVNTTVWVSVVSAVLMESGVDRSQLLDVGLASGAIGFRAAVHCITNSSGGVEAAGTYLAAHLDAEVLSMELPSRLPPNPDGTTLFCLALARKPFEFSWPRLSAKVLGLHESKEALRTMFEYLRKTAPKTTLFTWLAKGMPRVAEKGVQKIELAVVSEDMLPVYTTRKMADDFDQPNASFVELFIKAMALTHGRLVQDPPSRREFIVSRLERRSELGYSEPISSVVVPTLYQRAPHFYAVDVPPYFNYATVGALLATRIMEAVAPAYGAANETVAFLFLGLLFARTVRQMR
ncbi:hypothetical protein HPB51_023992 [Rhipicephalus microplus]|uniref:Peptidase M13 N-terminal domain-containing protein n=1 Tax=Rhipicephalus microplus TaxID=6941 RepID=A0A9J6EDA6_RHIMP|nr:hypothetical protein HPB51_023992 [Rhipicephalus microplus]